MFAKGLGFALMKLSVMKMNRGQRVVVRASQVPDNWTREGCGGTCVFVRKISLLATVGSRGVMNLRGDTLGERF